MQLSAAFSPNDSILYTTTTVPLHALYQYDLTAPNILNTSTLISVLPNTNSVGPGFLQLAPDHKIYWGHQYYNLPTTFFFPYPDTIYNLYNMNLSVINNPDSLGAACNFQPFSFYVGGARIYYGFPNNPDYDLAADSGSICDTITVGIATNELPKNSKLYIYYSPVLKTAFINADGLTGKKYVITIADLQGHLIYRSNGKLEGHYYTHDFNAQTFADGLYIISLITDKEALSGKFSKED